MISWNIIIKNERHTHTQGKEKQKGNPHNDKAVKARIKLTDVD